MNWIFKIAPLLLLICLKHVDVEGTELKITYKDGDDYMKITCLPRLAASVAGKLLSIKLSRKLYSQNFSKKVIASASPSTHNGQGELVDESLASRADVTAFADSTDIPKSFLEIFINKVRCEDSGEYMCAIFFMFETPDVMVDVQTINILSAPENVTMHVSPLRIWKPYFDDEFIQLRCVVDTGNRPVKGIWTWQWKYIDRTMNWAPYTFSDMKNNKTSLGNCSTKLVSSLKHYVQAPDNLKIIRCLLDNDAHYSDSFVIHKSCQQYLYGRYCRKTCNCRNTTEVCDVVTGFCESGCPDKWIGSNCSTRCHCSEYCSTYLKKCISCEPGYFGPTCQYTCAYFQYGENCLKKCNCLESTEVCDYKIGYCTTGCPDEWTGPACDIPCHCTEGCKGHMKECKSCRLGFHGKYCQEAWESGPYLLASSVAFLVTLIAALAICCRSKKETTTEVVCTEKKVAVVYDNPIFPKVEKH